jgi:hypothetical protein
MENSPHLVRRLSQLSTVLLDQRWSVIFRKMLNQFLSDGRLMAGVKIDPAKTGLSSKDTTYNIIIVIIII